MVSKEECVQLQLVCINGGCMECTDVPPDKYAIVKEAISKAFERHVSSVHIRGSSAIVFVKRAPNDPKTRKTWKQVMPCFWNTAFLHKHNPIDIGNNVLVYVDYRSVKNVWGETENSLTKEPDTVIKIVFEPFVSKTKHTKETLSKPTCTTITPIDDSNLSNVMTDTLFHDSAKQEFVDAHIPGEFKRDILRVDYNDMTRKIIVYMTHPRRNPATDVWAIAIRKHLILKPPKGQCIGKFTLFYRLVKVDTVPKFEYEHVNKRFANGYVVIANEQIEDGDKEADELLSEEYVEKLNEAYGNLTLRLKELVEKALSQKNSHAETLDAIIKQVWHHSEFKSYVTPKLQAECADRHYDGGTYIPCAEYVEFDTWQKSKAYMLAEAIYDADDAQCLSVPNGLTKYMDNLIKYKQLPG